MKIKISKTSLENAESGFTIFALLILTQALLVSSKVPWAAANSILRGLSWTGIYGVTLFLCFLHWQQLVRVATRDKLLILLLGFVLVSTLWSVLPGITLWKAIALVITSLFGAYFAMRYSLKEQLRLLAWMYGIAALFSLLFIVVLPQYGASGSFLNLGAWQGIYQQKNILGRQMLVGSIVFFLIALDSYRRRWVAWSGFGLCVLLLLGTTSKSALVGLLAVMVLLPFYRALRWNHTIAIPLFIIVILASGSTAVWLIENFEALLEGIGKEATLTGRTPLWDVVYNQMILERPWLGYGYGAFWAGGESNTSEYIYRIFGWEPPNAHSVYLDVWLDIGLLGLLVYVFEFLLCCLRAVTYVRLTKTAEGLWPLAFLTVIFLFSPVQSIVPDPNSAYWVMYVAAALSTRVRSNQASKAST